MTAFGRAKTGPLATFLFGSGGNTGPLLGDGWSFPEEGFTWAVGHQSRLRIPVIASPGRSLVLELELFALIIPGARLFQRLSVYADKILIGTAVITDPAVVAFILPEAAVQRGMLDLILLHPDAAAPVAHGVGTDTRRLALAVNALRLWSLPPQSESQLAPARLWRPLLTEPAADRDNIIEAACGLGPADTVKQFESLGQNCEFGLMQRGVGAEPLGLLRFAGLILPDLLSGLETAFAGVENADHIELSEGLLNGREEFMARAMKHGVRFHTNVFRDEFADPTAVIARVVLYLRYLRRHFEEAMISGERIFVLQHPEIREPSRALPVLARLCAWGPNKLLYVTRDRTVPAGTVRQEATNLFHGFIDRFVPPIESYRTNFDAWVSICANTLIAAHNTNRPEG
jgi:hypothetical protein